MEQRYIYLIRHGAINSKGGKRFIGQLDLPMTDDGIRQAERLQQEFSCIHFSGIYCSDLQRSRHTAEIIAIKHDCNLTICPELREISLGEWEGLLFEEISHKYPDDFIQRGKDLAHFCPPGGESFTHCSQRVLPKLTEIMKTTTGNILIAGHAGVNRLILCHILGMPVENLFRINQDFGCLNLIGYRNSNYRIKVLNRLF